MITRQPFRASASTSGEGNRSPVAMGGGYRYRFAAYARAREDGKSVPAAASAAGIPLDMAKQYEQVITAPPAGPEPVTVPALGPTEVAVLAAVAASDGLTVAEMGERLRRKGRSFQRSVNSLRDKGHIAVLAHSRASGTPAAVWGATSTGRAALEAHQQGARA